MFNVGQNIDFFAETRLVRLLTDSVDGKGHFFQGLLDGRADTLEQERSNHQQQVDTPNTEVSGAEHTHEPLSETEKRMDELTELPAYEPTEPERT